MSTATKEQELVITPLQAVTVSPPETTELVTTLTQSLLPLKDYRITSNADYVAANTHWQLARTYLETVDAKFKAAKQAAFAAHRAITSLEGEFKAPAEALLRHLDGEILTWKKQLEKVRLEKEAQIAREQAVNAERERAENERTAAEERARREAELADLPPWEQAEAPPIVVEVKPVAVVKPVRLPSAVPIVMGGPRSRKKPMKARIDDPIQTLKWILENPIDRLSGIQFHMPWWNDKAVELGYDIGKVIPGVSAYQDETLTK